MTTYYSGGAGEDRPEPVGEGTPLFRDISLSNILARGARVAGEILGLPEMPIQGVTLDNVKIAAQQGFVIRHAKDITFHRTRIEAKSGPPIVQQNVVKFDFDGAAGR
jgi:hypothetical protein